MSTPMFQTGRRKIAPTFGGFTPAAGRSPILCLATQFLHADDSPVRWIISHASLSLYRAQTFDKIMYTPITDTRY